MGDSNALVPVLKTTTALAVSVEDFMPLFTVEQAIARKAMVNQFIADVMRSGEDYGAIPGGNQKPVLLKPGAEKLCAIFGLAPRYVEDCIIEDWLGEHHRDETFLFYRVRCQLWRGDRLMGEASGSCNSWESKYRYRESKRKCPTCGQEAIIAGKAEYGGGWLCWKKKSGCGAKFEANDPAIVSQEVGRVQNEDIADQANTILKMAQKRALVAAVLVVTNCSDAFTQDMEDGPPPDTGGHPIGTQAASDHVKEKKLAEARASKGSPTGDTRDVEHGKQADSTARNAVASPNPPAHPTLAALFASIEDRSKPSNVRLAFEMIKGLMVEAMPANGAQEYQRLFARETLSPQNVEKCKEVMTEMWNMICFAKEQAAKLAPQVFVASDEDVPQFSLHDDVLF